MIVTTLGLLAAASLQVARFGPHQNIVVERLDNQPAISAYGDAHVVRLRGSDAQFARCVSDIRAGHATECAFAHSGTLDFRPLADGHYEFRFNDALKANVVDFVVDADGLKSALDAMANI
ncbi:hypothetical protein [Dokdonella sp.]|uniref:hypothetical protein n=1 Tax=Dokdonella sp. TaxID=2291710 RepID=UPI001B028AD9|nr:hypothetical protein [Dokdonella sp.]MBO9663586.1 hypothetical protein [Dokdonella sp.]